MKKIPLIETYDNIPSVSEVELSESLAQASDNKLARVDGKYIIGMVEGQFFLPNGMSRNGRFYPRDLWERVLRLPETVNRFKCSNMFGQIGHSEGPVTDIDLRHGNASHFIDELWINENGQGMGRCYILNTPAGNFLKTYLGAGCKLKVSTRGLGTLSNDMKDGCPIVESSTYELQTVDFVINPGFLETNPKLMEAYNNIPAQEKSLIVENAQKEKGERKMNEETIMRELKEQRDEYKQEAQSLRQQLVEKEKMIATLTSEKSNKDSINESLTNEAETMKKSLIESEEKIVTLTEELNSFKAVCKDLDSLQEATSMSAKAIMALSKYQELGSIKDIKSLKENCQKMMSTFKDVKSLKENCEKMIGILKDHKELVSESSKSLKTIKKLVQVKENYEKRLDQMKRLLEEYSEYGSVRDIKNLFKLSESTLEKVALITKSKATEEAKKLSEEFKCTVESANKLIIKYGPKKARDIISENQEKVEQSKLIGSDLLKEEASMKLPELEGPQKFLSKGMISRTNAFGFNPEALGKEEEKPLLSIKAEHPNHNVAKWIKKPTQPKDAPKPVDLNPRKAEEEAKKIQK